MAPEEMVKITDTDEIKERLTMMDPAELVTTLQTATYYVNVLPNTHPDVEAYRVWMSRSRELIIDQLWRAP